MDLLMDIKQRFETKIELIPYIRNNKQRKVK